MASNPPWAAGIRGRARDWRLRPPGTARDFSIRTPNSARAPAPGAAAAARVLRRIRSPRGTSPAAGGTHGHAARRLL